jgi:putative aldouronate transport system substrate-binding protein
LDDYFKKELSKTYELLGADFLSGSVISGHNYGIPCNKEKARDYGFVYNKTLADKYNLDMTKVKTFKDIEPMLKVIKEKEPDVIPLHFEQQGAVNFIPWNFENLMKNNGYATAIKDGKVINAFESPEFADAFAIARDFYNKGYYRPDVLTAQDGPTIMQTGKWFAFSMNLKPDYDLEYQARYPDVDWVCAQQEVTDIRITNSDTMGSMQAISRTSKDPQRAAMFLELVNTDAYLSNLINYGIEGKHYTKVSDNVIRAVKDNQYGPNMQWMFGNQMLTYLNETESPEKWQKYVDFNKNAIPNEDLGFIFNIEPVQTELSAVANIVNEYFLALTCGAVDPAVKLPEMNAKLKAAGVDTIIAEEQKQFDAWKASK